MQKGKIKIIALIGVFFLTILIVGLVNRHSNKDTTDNMAQATLPVVSFYFGDQQVNELHGHTAQMDAVYMRDSITPLKKNRILPICANTYGEEIDKISYEIRSMDTSRLVAEAEVKEYSVKEEELKADIKIQNIIEEGKEYLMVLKIEQGSKEIYYYTRLIQPVDSYVDESLEFTMDFHDTSMNKETAGKLATYLEPDASADNNNLNLVTIHSSLRQLTWGNFKYHQVSEPVPSIKEISSDCNVITLRYNVASEEEGSTEYYNVEEYYRVRYTSARPYLLNYERTMNRIFSGEENSVYDKYIQLGIRSKDVDYVSNENGTVAAFVQEGDLWSYNCNSNQMSKVFSFRSDKGEPETRENYDQHDIRIVSVDESGNMDFLIYGYMNRGIHEGRTGISVCRYDTMTNTVEEQLFIPVTTSYQVMKEDLGDVAYQNNQKQFFLAAGGTLYQIDPDSLEVKERRKGLEQDDYSVSRSGRFFAYREGEQDGVLHLEDLETGASHEIKANGGEKIRILGFIGEDFVYGAVRDSDVAQNVAGDRILPMYQVKILSPEDDCKVVKTYEKGGYYVSDVRIEGNTIYLDRLQGEGGRYQEASGDTIVNSEEGQESRMDIHTTSTEKYQTQIQIELSKEPKEEKFKRLTSKEIVHEEPKEVELELKNQERYYAYAAGKVILGSNDPAEAICAADGRMGVVIGQKQKYIWKRTKKSLRESLIAAGTQAEGSSSVEKCLNLILNEEGLSLNSGALLNSGASTKDILQEALKDCEVLDLRGCSVQQILYYVSCGTPVLVMESGSEAVLIVGYDASTVLIYEPGSGNVRRENLEEAAAQFQGAGNVFCAYLK